MIDRLIELGFSSAEIVGEQKGKKVVRAIHPVRGPMYDKIAEGDDAALVAFAERANAPPASQKLLKVTG